MGRRATYLLHILLENIEYDLDLEDSLAPLLQYLMGSTRGPFAPGRATPSWS